MALSDDDFFVFCAIIVSSLFIRENRLIFSNPPCFYFYLAGDLKALKILISDVVARVFISSLNVVLICFETAYAVRILPHSLPDRFC